MKIGVISDTHDKKEAAGKALSLFKKERVSLVIHCGDWSSAEMALYIGQQTKQMGMAVKGVLGNMDHDAEKILSAAADYHLELGEEELVFDLNGVKALIYHGHDRSKLKRSIESEEFPVIFTGHTHKPFIGKTGSVLLIDPGSTGFPIPRGKTTLPSVAILDTSTGNSSIHYLDQNKLII